MKKRFNQLVAFLLASTLLLSATGCSKKTDSENTTAQTASHAKDYVYSIEEFDAVQLDGNVSYYNISKVDDKIFLYGNDYSDDGSCTMHIASFGIDGSNFAENTFFYEESNSYSSISYDGDGNIYAILNNYDYSPDNYHDNYYLIKFDSNFNELWRTDLRISTSEEDDYFYPSNTIYVKDTGLFVNSTQGLNLYDPESGEFVKTATDAETVASWQNLYTSQGKLYVTIYDSGSYSLYELDDNYKIVESSATNIGNAYSLKEGIGYTFIGCDNTGLYGLNIGNDGGQLLLNYIDSNIDTYSLDMAVPISETEFLAYFDNGDGNKLYKLTKVDPKDVVDKKVLTLGTYYIDYDIRKQVVKFNQNSDEYKISIIDYSKYNTDADYEAGLTKLNNDIVSGNTPDILILSPWMPYESYFAKGVFEDLQSYFENDEELSKNEYLDNVIDAFKYNGKMYAVVPTFSIETVVVKKSVYDSAEEWTVDGLTKLMKDMNVDTSLFGGLKTRNDMFQTILKIGGSHFVDFASKECKYDTDEFKSILELVAKVPEEIDESYWDKDTTAFYRDNTSILEFASISSFSNFNYIAKGDFGEEVVIAGFPSEEGGMSSITANTKLCMSASCKYKDGAWQFLRYFYTDEYQTSDDVVLYNLPVSIKALNQMAELAKQKPSYTDDEGNLVTYDETYYVGNQEIIIEPMTDSEVAYLTDFIKSLNNRSYNDNSIQSIIDEEASAYFAGQKSVDDVSSIIQSRVKIYVEETN